MKALSWGWGSWLVEVVGCAWSVCRLFSIGIILCVISR